MKSRKPSKRSKCPRGRRKSDGKCKRKPGPKSYIKPKKSRKCTDNDDIINNIDKFLFKMYYQPPHKRLTNEIKNIDCSNLTGKFTGMSYGDDFVEGIIGEKSYLYTVGLCGCVAMILFNPDTKTVRLYHIASDMTKNGIRDLIKNIKNEGFLPWRLIIQAGGKNGKVYNSVRVWFVWILIPS